MKHLLCSAILQTGLAFEKLELVSKKIFLLYSDSLLKPKGFSYFCVKVCHLFIIFNLVLSVAYLMDKPL
jgi:hypothetical protein